MYLKSVEKSDSILHGGDRDIHESLKTLKAEAESLFKRDKG
jgi:hypothetical protein